MLSFRIQSLFYYALPVAYLYLTMVRHFGDLRHGATVMQWMILQGLAVAVLLGGWILFTQVGKVERVVLVLCAIYPAIGLGHTLLSMMGK